MARPVEDVELEGLSLFAQRCLELSDLLGSGVLVIGAEQPEQRTRKVLRQVDDGPDLEGEPRRWRSYDKRAIAVDRRVELQAARGEERLSTTRSVADGRELAIRRWDGSQMSMAPCTSPTSRSSGTPPWARAAAAASSGLAPGASRE